jgi:hypothetical protein
VLRISIIEPRVQGSQILWVVRVGRAPDLDMVLDLGVGCAVDFQHLDLTLRSLTRSENAPFGSAEK